MNKFQKNKYKKIVINNLNKFILKKILFNNTKYQLKNLKIIK